MANMWQNWIKLYAQVCQLSGTHMAGINEISYTSMPAEQQTYGRIRKSYTQVCQLSGIHMAGMNEVSHTSMPAEWQTYGGPKKKKKRKEEKDPVNSQKGQKDHESPGPDQLNSGKKGNPGSAAWTSHSKGHRSTEAVGGANPTSSKARLAREQEEKCDQGSMDA